MQLVSSHRLVSTDALNCVATLIKRGFVNCSTRVEGFLYNFKGDKFGAMSGGNKEM
jgi:hypothetical protein